MTADDGARIARAIVEGNRYLVLATADATGRPWSSPVYFAHIECREFFWVSSPGVTHSRNIAVRPEVGIVIFDSQAPFGAGQGVYMSGVAKVLDVDAGAHGLEAYSCRSFNDGGQKWGRQDLGPDTGVRLYSAVADSHWLLAKDGRPAYRAAVTLS